MSHFLHNEVSGKIIKEMPGSVASGTFCTLRFKEKEKRAAVVAKATVHKQGSVQWFKVTGRLEFSVGYWFM